MAPDTVFDLASLTKPLVGAGVALALVDRGCCSLDEEVTTWLPELDQLRGEGVTLRRLLAHTAGITGWRPVYTGAAGTAEVVRAIGGLGLAAHARVAVRVQRPRLHPPRRRPRTRRRRQPSRSSPAS